MVWWTFTSTVTQRDGSYCRCPVDRFTPDDFRRYIYNEDYIRIDPDYVEFRPRRDAECMAQAFPGKKPQRVLDYGGGTGIFADTLRSFGFSQVDTYDPYNPRYSSKPARVYDCVVSFQVMEHAVSPALGFGEISDSLLDPGLAVISTLIQPADIDRQGLNWWYAGPRNGHVSLYSRESLARVVQPFGLKVRSLNDNLHLMYRDLPEFARHLVLNP
jgi:hypothetical protein